MKTDTYMIVNNQTSAVMATCQDHDLARAICDATLDTHLVTIETSNVQEFVDTFGVL